VSGGSVDTPDHFLREGCLHEPGCSVWNLSGLSMDSPLTLYCLVNTSIVESSPRDPPHSHAAPITHTHRVHHWSIVHTCACVAGVAVMLYRWRGC
jgi:hypothetical protein